MLYCYILGCGIACLIFTGISSMDTVDVKPVEVALKTLLWPVALVRYLASLRTQKGRRLRERRGRRLLVYSALR